jgi:sarcosine oxidase subunit gamma
MSARSAEIDLALLPDAAIASLAVRKGRQADLSTAMEWLLRLSPRDGPRKTETDGMALLGVGPGRWLAISEAGAPLYERLAAPLAGLASLCEQGDGYAVFAIGGPASRRVLAKGVPVDLHPAVFAPDAVAVTLIAHMGAIVWRADEAFRIAVFRSYARSFWHWLTEAAAEAL